METALPWHRGIRVTLGSRDFRYPSTASIYLSFIWKTNPAFPEQEYPSSGRGDENSPDDLHLVSRSNLQRSERTVISKESVIQPFINASVISGITATQLTFGCIFNLLQLQFDITELKPNQNKHTHTHKKRAKPTKQCNQFLLMSFYVVAAQRQSSLCLDGIS